MAKMMGEVTLLALGVMISPSAIIVVILLVLQRRGISSSVTFVAGRMLAILLVLFSMLTIFRNLDFSPQTTASHAAAVAKLVIGVLLLLLGLGFALSKSNSEEAGWLQRRMDSIERLSPRASGGLGFAFGLLSPRCLFLTLAAAATILHADTSVPGGITALALFIVVANLAVLAPLVIYMASPEKSASPLDNMRKWIIRYQRALVMGVLIILGTYLVIRGTLDLLQ